MKDIKLISDLDFTLLNTNFELSKKMKRMILKDCGNY